MTDTPPISHEQAETVLEAQGILITKLPNGIEKREAERLQGVIGELVHRAIENAESASERSQS